MCRILVYVGIVFLVLKLQCIVGFKPKSHTHFRRDRLIELGAVDLKRAFAKGILGLTIAGSILTPPALPTLALHGAPPVPITTIAVAAAAVEARNPSAKLSLLDEVWGIVNENFFEDKFNGVEYCLPLAST